MTTYKIIRFRFQGTETVVKRGLTLEEAQEHCNDPKTSGDGWFDGWRKEENNCDQYHRRRNPKTI